MDGAHAFLEDLKQQGWARGNLRGLFHIVIGRRIEKADGTLLSAGVTWREFAKLLKRVRWPKEDVAELGLDQANLPPRNREHYWYVAIAQAGVDSAAAVEAGDRLAAALKAAGYNVGPAPGQPG